MSLGLVLTSVLPGVHVCGVSVCATICRHMENTATESDVVCPDAFRNLEGATLPVCFPSLQEPYKVRVGCHFHIRRPRRHLVGGSAAVPPPLVGHAQLPGVTRQGGQHMWWSESTSPGKAL